METKKRKILPKRKRITPAKLKRDRFKINIFLPETQRAIEIDDELPDLDNFENDDDKIESSKHEFPFDEIPDLCSQQRNCRQNKDNKNQEYAMLSSSSESGSPVHGLNMADETDFDFPIITRMNEQKNNVLKTSEVPQILDSRGIVDFIESEEYINERESRKDKGASFCLSSINNNRRPSKEFNPVEIETKSTLLANNLPTYEAVSEKETTQNLEDTEEQKSNLHLRYTDQRRAFCLSELEWRDVMPNQTVGRRRLEGNWTELFTCKLKTIFPGCVLCINQIKQEHSRKRKSRFFSGKAICQRPGCTLMILLVIEVEPCEGEDVPVQLFVEGNINHEGPTRSQLRGNTRKVMANKAKTTGIMNTYYNNIVSNSEDITRGDFSLVPTPKVLKQAVFECMQKEKLHKDICQELVLLKEAYVNDDVSPKERYAGYVQYIAVDPFTVIAFCLKQINLLLTQGQHSRVNLYLDATGTIIKSVPGQKRPLLYSLVIKPENSPPVSVSDMITTDHTIPSVCHFLQFFLRAVLEKKKHFHPLKIETDFSWTLIQSSLKAFSDTNVKKYLNEAWHLCTSKPEKLNPLTVVHICIAHMTKTLSVAFKAASGKNKECHGNLMSCFVVLSNETCIKQTRVDFGYILKALLLKPDSEVRRSAWTHIQNRLNNIGRTPEETEDFSISDTEVNQNLEFDNTIRNASPWTAFFENLKKRTELEHSKDILDPLDNAGNIAGLEILLKRFLPIFPLWSGILLGPLERYLGANTEDITVTETRDSNANVEAWFQLVKTGILRKQTRLRPAEFFSKLKKSINGRLLEAETPELRSTKPKRTEITLTDLSEETWSKRPKSRKKNKYQPHKVNVSVMKKEENLNIQKTGVSSFPLVPTWGGEISGITLTNTCTLDNFLTILHVYALENKRFVEICMIQPSITLQTLSHCLTLMGEHHFVSAKMEWVTLHSKSMSTDIDLFGSEYEVFGKYIGDLLVTEWNSICENAFCLEPNKTRTLTGVFLSCKQDQRWEERVTVQRMLDDWISPRVQICRCGIQRTSQTRTVTCGHLRKETRDIKYLPPVVILPVDHLELNNCIGRDVTYYDKEVTIGGRVFRLAGVTMHKPGHFMANIYSKEHGWLHYDGLQGELVRFSEEHHNKFSPGHIIYVLRN